MTDYEQFIKLLEILNFELEYSKGQNKYSRVYNNDEYFFKIPMNAKEYHSTKQIILCNKTPIDINIKAKISFKEIKETVEYLKDEFKYELRKIKINKIL